MRALVTGATGFVGRHLLDALAAQEVEAVACGGPDDPDTLQIDLDDVASLRAALERAQPDVVFHLAAQAFVGEAIAVPEATYRTNTLGCAHLTQAIREYVQAGARSPRVLFASSADVYGMQPRERFPLNENVVPNPANPYAASKAAAEMLLLGEAHAYGLDVVIARAFNHIGPGQSEQFVVASFAAQLARIAAGADPVMYVGNLDAKRDFLDVRDVVRAYVALAHRGASGETYNVASGVARSIREVLRELILVAHVPVEVRDDPARMRPADVPIYVGENGKLRAATGWEPEVAFRRSIADIWQAATQGSGRADPN